MSLLIMLRTSQCHVVLKGRNFHNRRSSTYGERMVIPLLPERQDFRDPPVLPFRQCALLTSLCVNMK
jgi:hypothetical protein